MYAFFIRTISCLTLALLLAVAPSVGQKLSQDPRPLTGLDGSSIRSYASVEALMQAERGGGLRAAATYVGRAQLEMQSLAAPRTLTSSASAGKQTPRVQLLEISRAENGTARWISGKMPITTGDAVRAAKNSAVAYQEQSLQVLEVLAPATRLARPREELRPMQVQTDPLGYTHTRFEQVYQGIPVWGRDLYVHFDADGEVYAINGTYEPTPAHVETTPVLATATAVDQVVAELKQQGRWAPLPAELARRFDMPAPAGELVLYPDGERGIRLAYEVTLHPNLIEWFTYIVDARDGSVINRIQRHCSVNHQAPTPVIQVEGFAGDMDAAAREGTGIAGTFHDAQALDLNGVMQSFRVYRHDTGSYYSVWDLPNLDAAKSTMPDDPAGGALTISLNNSDLTENATLLHVTSSDNTWTDAAGVSAHVNMSIAYDYFKNVHSRNAIDGKDQSIISIVHATMDNQPMDNAFWNGRVMVYGDGAQLMKPLAGGLDVAGHEMSHGVIEHTAGLVYQFQPGALNESFADVFGAMVDRDDLLMGEDIMRNHVALRDLLNPDNPQLPNPQPAHMNQYLDLTINQDNGGVHVNSGIPNRAAALIINSIGHEKTEAIYYRALASYLTRNSQFGDARKAVIQAATDLYGAGSGEVATVQQAFDQVGITDATTGDGGQGGGNVPPQTGGRSYITFMTSDGSIGLMDLTDPGNVQYGLLQLPGSVARAHPEFSDWSQLSAPSHGNTIWFVSEDGYLSYIDLATMEVWILDALTIEANAGGGDIWNAAISPDEQFVALISAYNNDPNLYFTDGQNMFVVPLRPEGTQPGTFVESIQYADAVSWSPNMENPRVAFDALNQIRVGNDVASFWGMYEIDFASEKVFNLVPAQPSTVSIGNVSYSKLSGDLLAFNYFDENWVADVMVADFSTGQISALEIPSFTYGGFPIQDAMRPTFAPNDALLAFSSPTLGALLFYDPTSQQLNVFELGASVHNPYWFLSGGAPSTDAEDAAELPSMVTLHGNYPNPFNPTTMLQFDLPEAMEVRLEVFDLMGRRVQTLAEGTFTAGSHGVTFNAHELASGTYLARLQAGETVAIRKMVLMR